MLTWSLSTNSNLSGYTIRMSPGTTYDSSSATVIGSVPPGLEEFRTTDGLASPGDVASFKVFVNLSTGNSAGSDAVVVTRP